MAGDKSRIFVFSVDIIYILIDANLRMIFVLKKIKCYANVNKLLRLFALYIQCKFIILRKFYNN